MSCACCSCLSGAGPHLAVENRPGLSALRYRIGTHGSLLEDMIRRLTIPIEGDVANFSLHALTTRETDDPAIAFLDAWAVVGDVLTFYQERIANEGFLRTAIERRSILELGRLVGYTLKPGVSSSVFLAYTVDPTTKTTIPAGTKAQSIPGANEMPQMFETSEDFEARGVWNALKPRLGKPQEITIDGVLTIDDVWIGGTNTRISAGDPLLLVFSRAGTPVYAMRRALKTKLDTEKDRMSIALDPVRPYFLNLYEVAKAELAKIPPEDPKPRASTKKRAVVKTPPPRPTVLERIIEQILLGVGRDTIVRLSHFLDDSDPVREAAEKAETEVVMTPATQPWTVGSIVKKLASASAIAPASRWQYSRSLQTSLSQTSDFLPRLVSSFIPQVGFSLHAALGASTSGSVPFTQFESLHVLRKRASVFGYNAPTPIFEEPPAKKDGIPVPARIVENDETLYLDSQADAIRGGSYVVVHRRDAMHDYLKLSPTFVRKVRDVETASRTAYVMSGKTTRLTLDAPWAYFSDLPSHSDAVDFDIDNLSIIRGTMVLAESEELKLAQLPVTRPIGRVETVENNTFGEGPTRIDLDAVVEGLEPGRFVIVSGERVDVPGTKGVVSAELTMVAAIELHPDAPAGGTAYSTIVFAPEGLKYEYDRATVKIYANVVKATHGDTRSEILGAGEGAKALQTFTLKQTPLTFVSAPTVNGVESTLAIRVNDILWHETDTFFGASPDDRVFITKTADDGKVSVIFGNGREGSRLPTGPDNVRSTYRTGIGKPGNVRAGQIATAISRPLGVKDVINPLAASGGADPESRDDARRNIPVSLQAMNRIVSVRDYADFARTFAGINKAVAIEISDGRRQIVHLTVGGAGDIEIDVHSDLYRNLNEALRRFGDPYQPFVVAAREKLVIAGSARVRVHPDYLWTSVAPKIRAALIETFSYDRRDFAQVVFPSEVIATIQDVEGVVYVDLDTLGSIAQDDVINLSGKGAGFGEPDIVEIETIVPQLARLDESGALRPAEIAYLPPELADLFVLTEIEDEK